LQKDLVDTFCERNNRRELFTTDSTTAISFTIFTPVSKMVIPPVTSIQCSEKIAILERGVNSSVLVAGGMV
jgi:hypothetical protein